MKYRLTVIFVCLYSIQYDITIMATRFISSALSLALIAALFYRCSDNPTGKFKNDPQNKGADQTLTANFVHHENAPWQKDWSTKNVVVYHWRGEPDNLHPTNGKSASRRVVLDYTQRFLVGVDLENLTLRPDLVKTLPTVSENELEHTYELRDEPVWDDGQQLSVDDVIFTVKAQLCAYTNNAHVKPYLENIRDIRKDESNPRKFTLSMSEKYIQNVAVFADLPIMQRDFYDKNKMLEKYSIAQLIDPKFSDPELENWAKQFNDNKYGRDLAFLNGLGAYKVSNWEDKQRLELTRKENHWTAKLPSPTIYDRAYPEKIIFSIILDETALKLGLKDQSIDASYWVSTTGLIDLQKDPQFNRNFYSEFLPNYNYQYLGMNLKPINRQPFFTDVRVRRAMAMLIPIDKVNATFFANKASRLASMVTPIKKNVYNSDLKLIALDIEGAKKLLDEAGWKDTDGDNIRDKVINGQKVKFEFELAYMNSSPIFTDIMKMITDGINQAGVKANPRPQEFVRFYELAQQHDFDMIFGAWNGSFYADDYKQIWHSDSWNNKGSNFVGFGTPESDQLIEEIRHTTNDSLRIIKEKKLQELIYNEQPYIFMFTALSKVVIHKRFANNDMYYEKPGIYLSNLRLNYGSTIKTADPN